MSKSIGDIKKEFEQADRQTLLSLYEKYADDNRAGVVSLISKYRKQEEKIENLASTKALQNNQHHIGSSGGEHRFALLQEVCIGI